MDEECRKNMPQAMTSGFPISTLAAAEAKKLSSQPDSPSKNVKFTEEDLDDNQASKVHGTSSRKKRS